MAYSIGKQTIGWGLKRSVSLLFLVWILWWNVSWIHHTQFSASLCWWRYELGWMSQALEAWVDKNVYWSEIVAHVLVNNLMILQRDCTCWWLSPAAFSISHCCLVLGKVQPDSQRDVQHQFSFAVAPRLCNIRKNSPGYIVLKQCETHWIWFFTKYKNRYSSTSRALFPSRDGGKMWGTYTAKCFGQCLMSSSCSGASLFLGIFPVILELHRFILFCFPCCLSGCCLISAGRWELSGMGGSRSEYATGRRDKCVITMSSWGQVRKKVSCIKCHSL